jgi:hypothetical protein
LTGDLPLANENRLAAERIVEKLDYLTLAVEIVGCYVKKKLEKKEPLTNLDRHYDDPLILLSETIKYHGNSESRYTETYENVICSILNRLSQEARWIALCVATFHPDAPAREWIREVCISVCPSLAQNVMDKGRFDYELDSLVEASLVHQYENNGVIRMHRLVRSVVMQSGDTANQSTQNGNRISGVSVNALNAHVQSFIIQRLESAYTNPLSANEVETLRSLVIQLPEDELTLTICKLAAETLQANHTVKECKVFTDYALRLLSKVDNIDESLKHAIYFMQGDFHLKMGDRESANRLLDDAYKGYKKLFGDQDARTLECAMKRHEAKVAAIRDKRLLSSADLYRRSPVLATDTLERRVFHMDSDEVNFKVLESARNDFLFEKMKEILGDLSVPSFLRKRSRSSSTNDFLSNNETVRELHEDKDIIPAPSSIADLANLVNVMESQYGPLNRKTLGQRTEYALQLRKGHMYAEALTQFELVVDAYSKSLGSGNRLTLKAREEVIRTHLLQGNLDPIKSLIDDLISESIQHLGKYDPDTVDRYRLKLESYQRQACYGISDDDYRELVDLTCKAYGGDHPKSIDALQLLKGRLISTKQFDLAVDCEASILDSYSRLYGMQTKFSLVSLVELIALTLKSNRLSEIKEHLSELNTVLTNQKVMAFDNYQYFTLKCKQLSGLTLVREGNLEQGLSELHDAFTKGRSSGEVPDNLTLELQLQYGSALIRNQNLNRAEFIIRDVYTSRKKSLGADHPKSMIAFVLLAEILYLRGDLKKALSYAARSTRILESAGSEYVDDYNNSLALLTKLSGMLE